MPTSFCYRVDSVAQYLGGLREQEKRIKRLESQVGRPTSCSSDLGPSPIALHPNIQTNGPTARLGLSRQCRERPWGVQELYLPL